MSHDIHLEYHQPIDVSSIQLELEQLLELELKFVYFCFPPSTASPLPT